MSGMSPPGGEPMIYQREGTLLFRRTLLGYLTEQEAIAAAKAAWKEGAAVRVERGRHRWHVWRSI